MDDWEISVVLVECICVGKGELRDVCGNTNMQLICQVVYAAR